MLQPEYESSRGLSSRRIIQNAIASAVSLVNTTFLIYFFYSTCILDDLRSFQYSSQRDYRWGYAIPSDNRLVYQKTDGTRPGRRKMPRTPIPVSLRVWRRGSTRGCSLLHRPRCPRSRLCRPLARTTLCNAHFTSRPLLHKAEQASRFNAIGVSR